MSSPPRFVLVVSNPQTPADAAAIHTVQTAPPYLQSIVAMQQARPGTATPFLVDTSVENKTTTVAETLPTLQRLAAAAAARAPSSTSTADAAARARAALLYGTPPAAFAPPPPAVVTAYRPPPSAGSIGGGGSMGMEPPSMRAAPGAGFPPPTVAAAAAPLLDLNSLATPIAGLGSAGGASLSRTGGGPAIGSGFGDDYVRGAPAPAGIIYAPDYARSKLDREFDAKGLSAPVAPGAAGAPSGTPLQVDKLIPQISEKDTHDRIPDTSELEERRRIEDEEIQSRKYRGGGRGSGPALASPF